jgi:hypothetical protein
MYNATISASYFHFIPVHYVGHTSDTTTYIYFLLSGAPELQPPFHGGNVFHCCGISTTAKERSHQFVGIADVGPFLDILGMGHSRCQTTHHRIHGISFLLIVITAINVTLGTLVIEHRAVRGRLVEIHGLEPNCTQNVYSRDVRNPIHFWFARMNFSQQPLDRSL